MVAAITLDLKKSQEYSETERIIVQKYLITIADHLNQVFKDSLLRDLRFSGGDELQGLFKTPENAFLCLRFFQRALNSIQFHAGIGIGEWSTVIDDKDTFYQDGSAYHRARRAIDLAKKEKEYTAVICSETNRDCIFNAMLNSCIQLIAKSMTSTSFQKDLIVLLECCYPIQSSIHIDLSELEKLPAAVGSYHSYNDIRDDSLAEENTSYIHGTRKKTVNLLKDVKAINPVSAETCISGSKLVFQEAHPYGAAKRLAEITGSTRQNVDKTLYRTNVYAERAISLALISELGKLRSDDLFAGEAEK